MTSSDTPWRKGRLDSGAGAPQLLFGQMYEDTEVEAGVFQPGSRVFAIASAGCTAIRLAAEHEVVAVDINPVQLAYAQRRAEGAPLETGVAERMMRLGRKLHSLIGWTRERVDTFFAMRDTGEQLAYWRKTLDTQRFRRIFDMGTSQALLRLIYNPQLLERMPHQIGPVLRARFERCWSRHPNVSNPYARSLFLDGGEARNQDLPHSARHGKLRFLCADAATYLESCSQGAFNAFTMSNIFDGTTPEYQARLIRAMKRAAAKDAMAVIRSFAEPGMDLAVNHVAQDRSPLWGIVQVATVQSL